MDTVRLKMFVRLQTLQYAMAPNFRIDSKERYSLHQLVDV